MPENDDEYIALLSEIEPEDIELLYKKTLTAIITIAAAYILGAAFFTVLLLFRTDYFYLAILFPLPAYIWIVSLGAKHYNNRYGFKRTVQGTAVCLKKTQNYSTYISVHAVIFIFSSAARLVYEVRNLILLKRVKHSNMKLYQ